MQQRQAISRSETLIFNKPVKNYNKVLKYRLGYLNSAIFSFTSVMWDPKKD